MKVYDHTAKMYGLKERPTVLFFWSHGTPRSGDSYDLQVNEA